MLLRYRYRNYITNDIIFVDSFTQPVDPNLKPNSLVIVNKTESNNTNTSVDVNISNNAYSIIVPNLQLGTYTVKISKKVEQVGAPSALFQVTKVDHLEVALVHTLISSETSGSNPEYFELNWFAGEDLKIRKYNNLSMNNITTYDGIYTVSIS